MSLLVVMVKELLESMVRTYRKALCNNTKLSDANIQDLKLLKEHGFVTKDNFYSKEQCENLRNKIDKYIDDSEVKVWIDDAGSDHRVYFINELDTEFQQFYENPKVRALLAAYTGSSEPSGMLLAARIDAKDGNIGSGGGWHRDSPITHQFKAICYLSDVDSEHGPFQYVKGSHKKYSAIKSYMKKIFKPGQFRFTEEEVSRYTSINYQQVSEWTGSQGSIAFADTKGIHRGKPIESGSRYALFCYFWHKDIPPHFKKYKQIK